jgi:hypothetical protein
MPRPCDVSLPSLFVCLSLLSFWRPAVATSTPSLCIVFLTMRPGHSPFHRPHYEPVPATFPAVSPPPSPAGGYDVLFNSIAQQAPPFPPVELVVIDELAHHRSQVRFSHMNLRLSGRRRQQHVAAPRLKLRLFFVHGFNLRPLPQNPFPFLTTPFLFLTTSLALTLCRLYTTWHAPWESGSSATARDNKRTQLFAIFFRGLVFPAQSCIDQLSLPQHPRHHAIKTENTLQILRPIQCVSSFPRAAPPPPHLLQTPSIRALFSAPHPSSRFCKTTCGSPRTSSPTPCRCPLFLAQECIFCSVTDPRSTLAATPSRCWAM